jgi:hypothetical protein
LLHNFGSAFLYVSMPPFESALS